MIVKISETFNKQNLIKKSASKSSTQQFSTYFAFVSTMEKSAIIFI